MMMMKIIKTYHMNIKTDIRKSSRIIFVVIMKAEFEIS